MSRFIKQNNSSQNVYIQFRFESSLRKYQSKPIKKIKSDKECMNCFAHHNHKMQSNSPISQRCIPLFSKGKSMHQQNTIQRHSCREQLSGSHMVSSNKTIKLSKRKQLQEISCNKDELQKIIYASLVNFSKVENKQEKSIGDADDVYLNDFEPSMDMDGEEYGQGDLDFGKIEIGEKGNFDNEILIFQKIQKQTVKEQIQTINNNLELKNSIQQERLNKIKEQDDISEQLQALRVAQISQEPIIQKQQIKIGVESKNKESQEQFNKFQRSQLLFKQPKQQILQNELFYQNKKQSQDYQDLLDQNNIDNNSLSENPFIRSQPTETIILSSFIQQNHINPSIKQKCLAFQGGRIYVDSFGQNFYISMRVLNKMRRQCSTSQDLINLLIHQRPYLQQKRNQIKMELQQYIKNSV